MTTVPELAVDVATLAYVTAGAPRDRMRAALAAAVPFLIPQRTEFGTPTPMSFVLRRLEDVSGVSGTGIVAEGVVFDDGWVALHWLGAHPSTAVWRNLDTAMTVHGHNGKTVVEWIGGVPS